MNRILAEEIISYQKVQISSANDISKCTCQFLTVNKGVPNAHGTGVFIKVNNIHFLITAAHVIEDYMGEVFIRFEENCITRIAFEISINKTNGKRKDDKTDIAILKLDEETVKTLIGFYEFLDETELGINHELNYLPMYLAHGYPCTLTKIKYKKNEIVANSTFFITKPADKIIYDKLECGIDKNLIICYNRNDLINSRTQQIGTGPDLYGMSGSGLWYIPKQVLDSNQRVKKKLVSLLTEWPLKDKTHVISTRIDVITEILRVTYGLNLPTSNVFRSKFDIENI